MVYGERIKNKELFMNNCIGLIFSQILLHYILILVYSARKFCNRVVTSIGLIFGRPSGFLEPFAMRK